MAIVLLFRDTVVFVKFLMNVMYWIPLRFPRYCSCVDVGKGRVALSLESVDANTSFSED